MKRKLLRLLVTGAVSAALLFWFFTAIARLGDGGADQGRQQLETALRRSAVACYAVEGVYPPTLDYLCAHYGVQIDRSRYHVFYEIFADNLMPQITVLERNP